MGRQLREFCSLENDLIYGPLFLCGIIIGIPIFLILITFIMLLSMMPLFAIANWIGGVYGNLTDYHIYSVKDQTDLGFDILRSLMIGIFVLYCIYLLVIKIIQEWTLAGIRKKRSNRD